MVLGHLADTEDFELCCHNPFICLFWCIFYGIAALEINGPEGKFIFMDKYFFSILSGDESVAVFNIVPFYFSNHSNSLLIIYFKKLKFEMQKKLML